MTHRYEACSALPRDAVRGGSVYLPCCEQVHGHRSVQSPAPGETQPATSLRHGPGCGWGCPTPSWGFQTAKTARVFSQYLSEKSSRDTLTVVRCERRRTGSCLLQVGVVVLACRGGTAVGAAQRRTDRPLSLLCLPRCSGCMRGD